MESVPINNYLFLHGTTQNAKRIRRKFTKKKLWKMVYPKVYETFDTDAIAFLYNYLVLIKQQKLKINGAFGVITDHNSLMTNIVVIPPVPSQWDVLCLDSLVSSYDFQHKDNNVYWCKMQVQDSHNFIINNNDNCIQTLLSLLKTCKTWNEFIKGINRSLNVFGITQHNLSENDKVYIDQSTLRSHNSYSLSCEKVLNKQKTECLNAELFVQKFDAVYKTLSSDQQYNVFPHITCICILNDAQRFFHLLHSFLKIDYPPDKLHMVIVDDQNLESKIKPFLPNEQRIKIVNISQSKQENTYLRLPVGYKLNLGVKYANVKTDIFFHMFDESSYFIDKFKTLVKTFLTSDKDILVSYDCASSLLNAVKDTPSIHNLMYRKDIHSFLPFVENESDSNIILAYFLKNRIPCVGYLPFLYFSFNYTPVNSEEYTKNLSFDLKNIVPEIVKESLELTI
jgi:hypothetical protein